MLCRQVVKRIRPVVVRTENRRPRCKRADPIDGGKLHLDAGRAELQIIIDPDLADGYRLGLVGVGDGKAAVVVLRIAGGIAVHRLFFHGIMLRAVGQIGKGMLPSIARIQFNGIHHIAGVLFFQMHRHAVRLGFRVSFVLPDLLNGGLIGRTRVFTDHDTAVCANAAATMPCRIAGDDQRPHQHSQIFIRNDGFQCKALFVILHMGNTLCICVLIIARAFPMGSIVAPSCRVESAVFIPIEDLTVGQIVTQGHTISVYICNLRRCKVIPCLISRVSINHCTICHVQFCIARRTEPQTTALLCRVACDQRIL